MSVEYDIYLEQHIANVNKAAEWLCDRFEDVAAILRNPSQASIFPDHDKSKYDPEEYKAYDAYFYGRNRSYDVVQKFNYAWLRHIHLNPHHWQYWVLQHDDEPEETLEMPYAYVVEMICDWWSFSFAKGNLMEIFNWYEQHKNMKLHENTRKLVEDFLKRIREELEKEGYTENGTLMHHGIIGQKWGVRNGPPYPIKGYDSVQELSDAMKSFKYKEFDKLMSADEVGKSKQGSCHDQVMYELQQLRRLGKNPEAMFLMEYNDLNQGGMTHSFVYYNENGKTHWFENAWSERAGYTEYNDLKSIKNSILQAHESGEFGDKHAFSHLIFSDFAESEHTIGEDLQSFVDVCLEHAYD